MEPFTKYSDEVIARFWAMVDKKGDDDCWLCTAGKDNNGYGRLLYNGKRVKAHRMSLEMYLGREITAGLMVCHEAGICHNPSCVNPKHLREDTRSANALDMRIDGTMPNAKLTEEQVLEIRASGKSQRELGSEYGVAQSMISAIKTGIRWKHILPTKE